MVDTHGKSLVTYILQVWATHRLYVYILLLIMCTKDFGHHSTGSLKENSAPFPPPKNTAVKNNHRNILLDLKHLL